MIFTQDIGIDLGTANTLVYVKGKGIVINEPSVIAVNKKTGRILAIGKEAKKMIGKTPAHIAATRPLVSGVISDFEITEQMFRYFLGKVNRSRFIPFLKSNVVVAIPCGVTEVEKNAVIDAAKGGGAGQVYLIEEPMASAIGLHLPIQEPAGIMVVDVGGGTTEVAIISLGGIVHYKSLRVAGDRLNQDIIRWAEDKFKLVLGERTAEELKIRIGSVLPLEKPLQYPMRGRDLVSGLPKEIIVSDSDVREAIKSSVKSIITTIKQTVEETPPELLADLMARGIFLVGGSGQLRRLGDLIAETTKIKVHVPEDPMTTVVRGCGFVVENLQSMKEVLASTEGLAQLK